MVYWKHTEVGRHTMVDAISRATKVTALRVLIGFDQREAKAAEVCAKSLYRVTRGELSAEFLCLSKLHAHGLLWRISDRRGAQDYDLISNEKTSTRFKISRFLTPMLCQQGWALFVDCDTIFMRDPREMLWEIEADHPVNVVKRNHVPAEQWKMVNQSQRAYARKNWSSVMLFNCDHPANRRLSLHDVNRRTANDLHSFYWLADTEIGELGPAWNWLVNVQEEPDNLGIAHFTLGGPWLPGWKNAVEHDDLWLAAAALK